MSLGSSNQHQNGSLDTVYYDYTHADILPKIPVEIEKLEYIYQHYHTVHTLMIIFHNNLTP